MYRLKNTNHSFDNFAKHHMSTVQPRRLFGGNEELRTISVLTSVGHGQPARAVMLELEVLVLKPVTVYADTAGAIAFGEIASLDHEVPDDPVELTALVSMAFRLLRQLDKVFGCLRYGRAKHADFHALGFVRAQLDVEPYLHNSDRANVDHGESATINQCEYYTRAINNNGVTHDVGDLRS